MSDTVKNFNSSEVSTDTEDIFQDASITDDESQTPPPIDAKIDISVSIDQLKAFIYIKPPKNGGLPPTLEAIEKAILENNIVYGIDSEKVQNLAQNPIYNKKIQIAEGKQAVRGTDGKFTLKFEIKKDLSPKERPDGSVDYKDLGIIVNVNKEQELCSIVLPTEGVEGQTVTGKTIEPVKGKDVPYMLGPNTAINEQGTIIYSTIDGQVDYANGKINVSETYYVKKNVDNSTGDIKVNGNVVIRGNILSGFTVEADGNIEVGGTVESAKLISGGKMLLRGGIHGSEVFCGGDFVSRFIENSNITIKGSARSEYIMDSNIRCGKSLEIKGQYARFSGGSLIIGEDFTSPVIGSPVGVKTNLELGTDPSIIERQQQIIEEKPKLEKQLQSLKQLISILEQHKAAKRLDEEKKQVLENALSNYESLVSQIESNNKELIKIHELIQQKGYGRIKCANTIHPGTVVKIGDEKMDVNEPLTKVTLYNDGEKICIGQFSYY